MEDEREVGIRRLLGQVAVAVEFLEDFLAEEREEDQVRNEGIGWCEVKQ